MSDHRTARASGESRPPGTAAAGSHAESSRRQPADPRASDDTRIAIEIRDQVARGDLVEARQRFADLVTIHQRRALRIAYQYLRDAADADEAVQDAFLKVFSHIASYRDAWPFEVWFTRILINGCLDRRKARARRERRFAPAEEAGAADEMRATSTSGPAADPEAQLLARERQARLAKAIDQLDGRQRTVFVLCHFGDCTPREIGVMTGLNESTVRVHLFRATRKLRGFLGGKVDKA